MQKGYSPRAQEFERFLQACEAAGTLQLDALNYGYGLKVIDIEPSFWEDLKADPILRALIVWRMGGHSGLSPYGLAEFAGGRSPLELWKYFVANPHRFRRDVCDATKLPVISPCYFLDSIGYLRHIRTRQLRWDTISKEEADEEYTEEGSGHGDPDEDDDFSGDSYAQELEELFDDCWLNAQPWQDFVGRTFQNPLNPKSSSIISKDTWASVEAAVKFQLVEPEEGALWVNPLTSTPEPWDPAVMHGQYDPTPEELARLAAEEEERRVAHEKWLRTIEEERRRKATSWSTTSTATTTIQWINTTTWNL